MKKIYQLTFVLFIFSVFALSYPVTQVFAQGGGQCDSNPACNPASGTCCGQCDSNPACNPNDSNGIPCCSSGINNMSSGTLPPRIPAPSGHDKMNHENRKLSDKSDLPEGEELRDAFKGCLEKLEMQDQREPNRPATNPAPNGNCSNQKYRANQAHQALNEICNKVAELEYQSPIMENILNEFTQIAQPKNSVHGSMWGVPLTQIEIMKQALVESAVNLGQLCQSMGREYTCTYTGHPSQYADRAIDTFSCEVSESQSHTRDGVNIAR